VKISELIKTTMP